MQKKRIRWIQGRWCGDTQSTVSYYLTEAEKTAAQDDLIVFPELLHTPYFPAEESPDKFDFAISVDSEIIQSFCQFAKTHECVLVVPFFEKAAPGIYFNSCLVLERDGNIVHHYNKTHIPDDPAFYEKYYFIPGENEIKVCPTSAGNLGIAICWDQWFPEVARLLCLQNAEILIYPTAIGWDNNEDEALYPVQVEMWRTMIKSHAIANGVYALAVNRSGLEGDLRFWGHSMMVAPDGCVLNNETEEPISDAVSIDYEKIDLQRRLWPFFRDRRTDLYQGLLRKWKGLE